MAVTPGTVIPTQVVVTNGTGAMPAGQNQVSFLATGGNATITTNDKTVTIYENVPVNLPQIVGRTYAEITMTAGAGVTLTGLGVY